VDIVQKTAKGASLTDQPVDNPVHSVDYY